MTFTYAVFAVPFICAGLYFYGKEGPKNRLLYTAMFGIACAISYFSAFAMLSLILADNMDITDNVDCTADRDCAPHLLKYRICNGAFCFPGTQRMFLASGFPILESAV